MRIVRTLQLIGLAIIVLAVPFLIFAPDSRPKPDVLGIGVAVAAVLGLASGLVFRYFVPLERRLEILRSMNPRVARSLRGNDDQDGS
jgi:formate-dependent nitrite reductase membrane component NrfD